MNKKDVINELKEKEDIKPDEYDGSYELVRKTIKLLGETDQDKLDYKDLDMLYLMTIGTWKSSFNNKKEKIKNSNLNKKNKNNLISTLNKIKNKSKNNEYILHEKSKKDSVNIGMFGTGFYTFNKGGNKPSKNEIIRFINMCVEINKTKDEENCIKIAGKNLKDDIYGLGTASLSQVLHCLRPKVFPVLNNIGIELYKKLGVNLESPNDITKYPINTKKIKKFRDDNFSFKNYRIIDNYAFTIFDSEEDINDKENDSDEKNTSTNKINYFWLTANPKIWSFNNIENGGKVFYSYYNENGNKRKITSSFEKAKSGDRVIFYESTPKKAVVAVGEVFKGLHEKIENGKNQKGISFKYKNKINDISWLKIKKTKELKNSKPVKNRAQGSLFELTKNEYNKILSLEEKKEFTEPTNILEVKFDIKFNIDNLYFPKKQKEKLINRIYTNFKNGKHIILTGPPGTGKSKLAKEIVNQYVGDNYKMVTARSDWSTFDTIGGYRPLKNGELHFDSGVFLECFKNNNRPDNKWLIIDEINRADIDKAFGSLFSALTGDSVSLSFKNKNDKNIKIIPQNGGIINNEDNLYTIPDDWRIIATMNTYDKTSLYEMSYAFMRRFAFLPVSIPSKINKELVKEYLKCWNFNNHEYIEDVSELWNSINKIRKIGPAIVEDIYKYLLDNKDDYSSVIISYVLPQFEGVIQDTIKGFIEDLKTLDFMDDNEVKQVKNFANDYFRLEVY